MTKRTTSSNNSKHPKSGPRLEELYNGDYVLVKGVSPFLADSIQGSIPDPDPPLVKLDDGSNYPNTTDPKYLRELETVAALRNVRMLQGVMYFGVRLCDEDGNPIDAPDDGWESKLRFVGVDWKKEFEKVTGPLEGEDLKMARNTAYLYYIAVTGPDMDMILGLLGVNQEAAEQAAAMFQRKT